MRTFLAIDLPEELKEEIFALAKKVTLGMDIKLVEKENLHLSLLFLGDIPPDKTAPIRAVLGQLPAYGKICLKLGEWEPYPKKQKPAGIWIGVSGDTVKLFSLYKKMVDELLRAGFIFEKNNFRFTPHITIGRIRSGGVKSLEKVNLAKSFLAKKITLFKSKLTSQGPLYSKLAQFEVK